MTKLGTCSLICCSLAGLKMSLRTGFCCRNVLAQDKIKVHRKTVPVLATHWHSRGPQSKLHASSASFGMGPCYRRQYWDGTFSPANFLHLLTCKFFTCSIGMAPSHLQFFSGRFFTCSFGMAPCTGLPNSPQKNINGIMAVLPQRLHVSRWKYKIHRENKNDQRNRGINLS